jgi:hypothetical protein
MLRPATLARHPASPREGPGDLTERHASIAEAGVLQPAVVVTAAAHLAAVAGCGGGCDARRAATRRPGWWPARTVRGPRGDPRMAAGAGSRARDGLPLPRRPPVVPR